MTIILYSCNDENNKLNKNLENAYTVSGNFRNIADISNPSFTLNTVNPIEKYNYCYIPDFGRYYYAKINALRTGLYSLDCNVDVLMSFKEEISNLDAIIERGETNQNYYLVDSEMKLYQYTRMQTLPIGQSFAYQNFVVVITMG